jgi:hypothetical protein
MAQRHRAERLEAAQKRKRQRRVLKSGAAALGLAVIVVAALIVFTGGDTDSPAATARQPATSAMSWEAEAFVGGPRLAVDRAVHDEGPVPYGHEVQAAFQLRNVGDQPLTLDELSVNTLEGC